MDSVEIRQRLYELGADLCGIAPIERFGSAPEGFHPTDVLPGCKSVIVFACRFLAGTLKSSSTIPYTIVRNILSDRMDKMSVQLCTELEMAGIVAIPTGTNGPSERDEKTDRTRTIVSAKHSAEAAGLGRIGKNSMLITPEYGNMVWLSVILTEALLTPDLYLEKDYCGGCELCIEACPVGAIGGGDMLQDVCWEHAFGTVGRGSWRIKCHRCRDVCPHCLGTKNRM